ncbi:uncharacterized protein LOC111794841 [Cucurbita pepo subsp. pepo]|uniref:uncharacterized protein LOC111794841 n=1 Tax=Cucurbita pepo subsp. pepo TaxID=3664 RepID=UPI000C9D7C13|nr:uncharacterized protein LOC111794841 [Cucurbita pepo subsp. pepo]XP_023532772.1 uncharacterized protein LOC111794841 [Cucurbita pepo subsp. pepo]
MASSCLFHNLPSISSHPLERHRNSTIFAHSQFLPLNSLKLRKQSFLSNSRIGKLRTRSSDSFPVVYAAQNNFLRVFQTVWKVGKDGIEAGTDLVPNSVPRPVARISVAIAALSIGLFLLKSVLSTAAFVLAMVGAIYFIFIALNKDEGPRGGGGSASSTASTEETLEEARKIMEKYK